MDLVNRTGAAWRNAVEHGEFGKNAFETRGREIWMKKERYVVRINGETKMAGNDGLF